MREFMTHKKKGRNNVTSMQAKQAILTACTYTQSGTTLDLDKIRDVIGMSKNTLRSRKNGTEIESLSPICGCCKEVSFGDEKLGITPEDMYWSAIV